MRRALDRRDGVRVRGTIACLVLLVVVWLSACGGSPSATGSASLPSGTWKQVGSKTLPADMLGDFITSVRLVTGHVRIVVTLKHAEPRRFTVAAWQMKTGTRRGTWSSPSEGTTDVFATLPPGRYEFNLEQAPPFAGARVTVYERR
jgi:hypothetical protein